MTCARCGAANDPGARFCEDCGAPLAEATCPVCGADVKPGARFCRSCGTALSTATSSPTMAAQAAAPSTQGAVAERRLVTVLFADLVGSTMLAEGRDPEETRELLGRYIEDRSTGLVHDVEHATEFCGIDGIVNATFYHFELELPDHLTDHSCMGEEG